MNLINIKDYDNFWIESNDLLQDYLLEVECPERIKKKKKDEKCFILDLKSDIYKKKNKSTALKDFTLLVRVSKVVDKTQKFKKKKFIFSSADNLTLLQALIKHSNTPEDLLSQIESEAEKQKSLDEAKVKQAKVDHVKKSNVILNDVWDEFYLHKTTGAKTTKWRDTTKTTYESFYNVWIRRLSQDKRGNPKELPLVSNEKLGLTPLSEVTKDDCITLIDDVNELRSLRTATTVIEVLRPMFDWYFDKYEVDRRNPVPSKKDYELNNKRIVDLSLLQVRELYQSIDNYNNVYFKNMLLWIRTGRRRGEIVNLKIENIDTIDKSFMVEVETNKAKVDMTYALRPELEDTLNDIKDGQIYLFESPRISGQSIDANEVSKNHWTKIRDSISGTFKLNGKRVGFTKLHLHDIRHIINGVLKRAEVPQEIREKVLGHKNTSINERYGVGYYDDIDKAYQLFLDIVYGVVPKDIKWGTV